MAKLDATGSAGAPGTNTVFLNNTAVKNMDFVSASAFKREAEISAKGYPLAGIRERLREVDGKLDLSSSGDGTVLRVSLLVTNTREP